MSVQNRLKEYGQSKRGSVGAQRSVLPYNKSIVGAAKALNGKPTEYRIAEVPGLTLLVQPSGTATYNLAYATTVNGKEVRRRLRLGRRDEISLADARQAAIEAKATVGQGADIVAEARSTRQAMTLAELVASYELKRAPELSPDVAASYLRAIRKDVLPVIGNTAAEMVTRDMIADIVADVAARGSRDMADRTKAAVGSVFAWGLKARIVKGLTGNPTVGIAKNATSEGRNRSITANELRLVWRGLDALPPMLHQKTKQPIEGRFHPGLSESVRICVRLCWLTGSRRSEVVAARLAEFDLNAKIWTIPGKSRVKGQMVGGRTKKGRTKVVPLSAAALDLVRRAMEQAGKGAIQLFPSSGDGNFPHIDPHSVTTAVDRITTRLGIDDLTLHDGRSALRTWLRDQGVDTSVLDAVLGHAGISVGARKYEAPTTAFIENRIRPALDAWGEYVMTTVVRTECHQ